MRSLTLLTTTAVLSLAGLTACNPSKQDVGIAAGAAIGAVTAPIIFGNSAWYTIAGGAAAGGFIGNYVGKKLDKNTQQRVAYTLNKAPDNQPYQFMGYQGDATELTVTPLRSYKISHQQCRDFELMSKDEVKTVYDKGSACKQTNGDWKIKA